MTDKDNCRNIYKSELSSDGSSLTAETKILFGQCGEDKRIHLTEVMEYCADFVTDFYARRGQNRDFLSEHGYAQMVSRSSFHINRLPVENDEVSITVREEKPEGVQLMRHYEFRDLKSGELLIEGKSLWVIVNPETRAVVFPSNFEFLAKPEENSDRTLTEQNGAGGQTESALKKNIAESSVSSESPSPLLKPGRIKIPENLEHLGDQKILSSMIDGNGHLTNAKYINFALDFLPEEYQKKQVSDFRINFCKEIRKGDTMQVNAFFPDESAEESPDEQNSAGQKSVSRNAENQHGGKKRVLVEGKIASSGERSFECEIIYHREEINFCKNHGG